MDIKLLDKKLNPWYMAVKYLWIAFVVILKDTCMNQGKLPFSQGGEYFYCKKNRIIIDYWYNIEFSIYIVGFLRY